MKKVIAVAILAATLFGTTVTAQAAPLDVFAKRTRITIVHVGGWTRGYSRVYFITRVHSGTYNEPARAVASVKCQGGFSRREFWNDHDGFFIRYFHIPRARAQGRCTAHIKAWTDTPDVTNGAVRITVALAVRRR